MLSFQFWKRLEETKRRVENQQNNYSMIRALRGRPLRVTYGNNHRHDHRECFSNTVKYRAVPRGRRELAVIFVSAHRGERVVGVFRVRPGRGTRVERFNVAASRRRRGVRHTERDAGFIVRHDDV